MMWDVVDLRGNLNKLEEKQAYVKWWAKRPELDLILDKLDVNFDDIKDALDTKEDLYCIFIGRSTNRSIAGYLNMQFRQSNSSIKDGLSAFRKTVGSIVSDNIIHVEDIDNFLDKLKIEIFYVDFPVKSSEAKEELDGIVKNLLKENFYILNIKGNNHYLADNIKKDLNKLKKEAVKKAENYLLHEKSISETEVVKTGENNMWFVTAGRKSAKFDVFKKRNFVAIGWNLGDLTGKNKEDIEKKYLEVYGNIKAKGIDVSQINKFVNDIAIGDFIVTSKKLTRSYLIGRCISNYFVSDELDDNNDIEDYYKNCRYVEWICEIGWEDLSTEAKDLIKPKSVYELKDAKKEFLDFIKFIPSFLNEEKRNIIYFGAPGTGKSYNLNQDMLTLLKDNPDNYERVTFHPDYSYSNFVGTYKPVLKEGSECLISYEYVPGPFMRTIVKALKNPFEPFLLIIEEINRANVAAAFGDVFQLLDREKNISQYPIDASEDMKKYLKKELNIMEITDKNRCYLKNYWISFLGKDYEKIKIPQNMFIWATMNSADQGVFMMDTAFKRRWDFKYFSINNNDDLIKNTKVTLNNRQLSWNDLRKAINDELLSYKINEDKLIGPFFAFNDYHNLEIPTETFKDIFKNKIIMYLFEDAARSRRNELFSGVGKGKNITYSQVCEEFDKNGIEIFNDSIKDKFLADDGE